jgi:probable HAF family extracellular repeat protein
MKRAMVLSAALLLMMGCDSITSPDLPTKDQIGPTVMVSSTSATYEATFLPTLGGATNNPSSINRHGVVVGTSENSDGVRRAYRWTEANGIHDLLASHSNPLAPTSAGSISSSGEVTVNGYYCDEGECGWRGFAYDPSSDKLKALPPLPGDNSTVAGRINDNGVILGYSYHRSEDGTTDGNNVVVWTPAPDGPYGEPFDFNCKRDLIGGDMNAGGDVVATCTNTAKKVFVWKRNGETYESPVALGTSMGVQYGPVATGIDDMGRVVGWVVLNDGRRGQLWHPADYAAPRDLGLIGNGGFVRGINNQNQVVGVRSRGNGTTATIWTVNGAGEPTAITELENPSGYQSAHDTGINDSGWVAGWASKRNSGSAAVLWRPVGGGDDGGGTEPPIGDGPTASFDYSCGNSPTCQFTDTSTEGEVAIVSRDWVVGSQTDSGSPVSFTFGTVGDHIVTLTVSDANHQSDLASKTVTCRSHPRHGLRCS